MSGARRVGAVVRRAAARLVPAGRRDWVEAVWAEAPEVPAGLRRVAWRVGGVWLMAREALVLRRIVSALLFAVAAAVVAWAAWPDSPASVATPSDQVHVIVLAVLAGCRCWRGDCWARLATAGPPGSCASAPTPRSWL